MNEITDIYDPKYVKGVFDRCSSRYIQFSYICSMGFTERWRAQCIQSLNLPISFCGNGYDLMAGTGEVWPHLIAKHPDLNSITAVDISSGMHNLALERLHKHRGHKIKFLEADILNCNIPSKSCDFIISTFGLKTFNKDQHLKLAKLTAHILKSGGRFAFIEASDPKGWWLRPLYIFHLKIFLPMIERLFLNGAQDFSNIGKYSTNFGNAQNFAQMLHENGLNVQYHRYFFGCATGVSGFKP